MKTYYSLLILAATYIPITSVHAGMSENACHNLLEAHIASMSMNTSIQQSTGNKEENDSDKPTVAEIKELRETKTECEILQMVRK